MAHDPGKHWLPLPSDVESIATFGGNDDEYRYRLEWRWDPHRLPTLNAILMNPSTADHTRADRTLLWVYRWCKAHDYGRLIVTNVDAYRCQDQKRLAEVRDPCGPDNMRHIVMAADEANTIVLGYGRPHVRKVADHGRRVVRRLLAFRLYAWALSKDGIPKHPLYLPATTELVEFKP